MAFVLNTDTIGEAVAALPQTMPQQGPSLDQLGYQGPSYDDYYVEPPQSYDYGLSLQQPNWSSWQDWTYGPSEEQLGVGQFQHFGGQTVIEDPNWKYTDQAQNWDGPVYDIAPRTWENTPVSPWDMGAGLAAMGQADQYLNEPLNTAGSGWFRAGFQDNPSYADLIDRQTLADALYGSFSAGSIGSGVQSQYEAYRAANPTPAPDMQTWNPMSGIDTIREFTGYELPDFSSQWSGALGDRFGRPGEVAGWLGGEGVESLVDVAASPVTWLTAGVGPALGGTLRGAGLPGRIAANLVEPIGGSSFAGRLAGETAMGAGAILGSDAAGMATEDMPWYAQVPAQLGGALLGGGGGYAGLRGADAGVRALPDAASGIVRGLDDYGEGVARGIFEAAGRAPNYDERMLRGAIDPETGAPFATMPIIGGAEDIPETVGRSAVRALSDEAPEVLQARRSLLDALTEETNIRRTGTATREIHEGRVRQAGGIAAGVAGALDEGADADSIIAAARGGARTGGLRQTTAAAVDIAPEVRTALIADIAQRTATNEISAFDFLRASKALDKLIAGEGLQPNEIRLVRQLLGDEIANVATQRMPGPKTLAEWEKILDEVADGRRAPTDPLALRAEEKIREATIAHNERAERQAAEAASRAERKATLQAMRTQERIDRQAMRDQWSAIKTRNDVDDALIERLHNPLHTTPEMRDIGQRRLTRLAEQEQRVAGAAFNRAVADTPSPGTVMAARGTPRELGQSQEQILRSAEKLIDEQVEDKALNEEIKRSIRYWMEGANALRSVDGDTSWIAARALQAQGDLADSYLTGLMHSREFLVSGLKQAGVDEDTAKTLADLLVERELRAKYPGGVPEDVRGLVRSTKESTANVAIRGAGDISQEWKNLAFSIGDVAVFGQQVLHAIRIGAPNIMAGLVNRTLNLAHLGARTDVPEYAISQRVRNAIDGVAQGVSTGVADFSDDSTLLRHLPVVGRPFDAGFTRAARAMNQLQFGIVLGTLRNLHFEGSLLAAKLTGADITDPLVRRRVGAFANAQTSYWHQALSANRREGERAALLSPSMRRAQVAQLLQVGKLLTGKREERLLAAMMLTTYGATTFAAAKVLHDHLGVGEFEWDPSKPGYGYITLRNRQVIPIFPQEQVLGAVARSIRILSTERDRDGLKDLAETWGKFAMGSSSPFMGTAEKAAGFGYDPERGYRFGDYGAGMSVKERVLNTSPLPPFVADAALHGVDKFSTPVKLLGGNAFDESASSQLARQYKDATGRDYWNDVKTDAGRAQVDAWIAQDPARQALSRESLEDSAKRGSEGAQRKLLSDDIRAEMDRLQAVDDDALDAKKMQGGDWRTNYKRRQDILKGAMDAIYQGQPPPTIESAMDAYYAQIRGATAANGLDVDWDAVDRWLASQPESVQNEVDQQLGLNTKGTSKVKAYRDDLRAIGDSGYWDLREKAWQEVATAYKDTPEALPLFQPDMTYDQWIDALTEYTVEALREQGKTSELSLYSTAENKVAAYGPVKKFNEYYKKNYLYPWVSENNDEFKSVVYWGYMTDPDKKLDAYLKWLEDQGK